MPSSRRAPLLQSSAKAHLRVQISELREILGDNLADSLDKGPSEAKTLLTLPLNVLTAVVIAVITICCLVLLVLAYFIRREFGYINAKGEATSWLMRLQMGEVSLPRCRSPNPKTLLSVSNFRMHLLFQCLFLRRLQYSGDYPRHSAEDTR